MKILLATALCALIAGPAMAQSATQSVTDAVTKSATEAASKTATDQINKAAGASSEGTAKAKNAKDNSPNYGNSAEHRMDAAKKQHGKNKK